jgi:hypothetical protein
VNRGVKIGIIGACGAAMAAAGGLGAYNLLHGLSSSGDSSNGLVASAKSTTPPAADQAVKTAQTFLADWQAGPSRYPAASEDTDSPSAAQSDLTGYGTGLGLASISFGHVVSAGPSLTDPGATGVTFTVTAKVKGGTWTYPDKLNVIQSNAGLASVDWSSAALYPGLQAGDTLAAGPVPATATTTTVMADDGKTPLTAAAFPSLADIITSIAKNGAGAEAPAGGSGVAVVDAAGTPVTTLKVFTAPKAAAVTTTIDPKLEAVAEKAVRDSVLGGKPASVVALDRTNGHILAIAYANTGSDGDTAIDGILSPGSTMKIITSAALFDMAGLTPQSNAPCTSVIKADSQIFHNDNDITPNSDTTIEQAFAESCNTAFIKKGFDALVSQTSSSDLHDEADNVFGLGSWSIGGGVQTTDPQVPADPQGSNAAADLIGQGQVEMTPLVLASLSATVRDGTFHQPIILPDQPQTPAAQAMNPQTDKYLQQMMDFDAHNSMGTAFPRMNGIPDSGAKTGTSELGVSTITTNGWFTAYDDNIAVAALVQGGTSGVGTAGYIVENLLSAD